MAHKKIAKVSFLTLIHIPGRFLCSIVQLQAFPSEHGWLETPGVSQLEKTRETIEHQRKKNNRACHGSGQFSRVRPGQGVHSRGLDWARVIRHNPRHSKHLVNRPDSTRETWHTAQPGLRVRSSPMKNLEKKYPPSN